MRTLLLLLTTVLVAYVPAVAQDAYILHPITRGFSPATDINDHGVAVGWWIGPKVSEGINTESGGYIWTKATGPLPMITDPAVVHMFPFYAGVNRPDENLKINAANEIAGIGCPEGCGLGFFTQAAVWSSSRGLTLLESFDGFTQQSGAAAINDAFLVVGYNWSGAGSNGPFRWTPAGGMQPLPVPGSGSAYDVNERGDIVGICLVYCGASQTDAPYQSAFYWSPDTGFAVIPHLPGSSVAAGHAINDLGVVVGMNFVPDNSGLGTGEYRIVRWSASTGLEDLSAPTGLPERIDINNDGDIVATILVAGVRVPYLYREGVWTDLNVLIAPDSGFRLGSVTSINNRGWMTGEGTHGGFDSVGFVLEPANRAPVASSSVLSTYEDTAISGVMAASDADGDVLNYEISTIASKGIVTIIDATTGAFLYTPFLNANGADAFTFSVSDGHSASGAATVTVNIAPVNDPPIAENGAIDVMAGVSIAGTLSAFDIDGPTLTYTILDNGTKGSAVVDAATGTFTYTAGTGSSGTDTFTFQASDGSLTSNLATVAVTIAPVAHGLVLSHGSLNFGHQPAGRSSSSPRYSVGSWPAFVASADLNADGHPDLVAANQLSHSVSVLLNRGDGTFAASVSYATTGSSPTAIVVRDFSGDGMPDVVVTNQGSRNVSVLRGNGDGTLQAAVVYPSGQGATAGAFGITAGDFNSDGNLDFAVANRSAINVLIGNGDGTFVPGGAVGAANALDVASGDLNDDGVLDLATPREVLLGNGDGTFGPAMSLNVPTNGEFVTVADYNGDGALDVASIIRSVSSSVAVRLGNGDGTFSSRGSHAVGRAPFFAAAGDLNGDGRADLAVASEFDSSVSVLLGNGNGTFQPFVNYGYHPIAESVAIADLNRDGIIDLAVANNTGNSVSVLVGKGDGTFLSSLTTTVLNTGNAPLHISQVAISGADAGDFFIEARPCVPTTDPGGGCPIIVGFAPATAGAKSATLQVFSDAAGSPHEVALSGFGLSEPANRAPVPSSAVLSTSEDTAISGMMAAADPDGDSLTFEISTNGSKGIATIIDATTGAFLYTPFPNTNGADVFTFSASDGQSASGAATVSVDIAPVNDPPIAQNGAIDVVAGASATGSLSAFDIDSPTLTYAILENGTKGSVVVDAATGSFTYTAAANSIGTDAFTFAAWDGVALSNEGLIAINITPAPPCAAGECPGAIDALINEVNALSLRLPAKRLLVRTLDTARTALERGRELQAIALLRVFIAELQVLQRTRLLSGATASPLITSARAIIDSVEG